MIGIPLVPRLHEILKPGDVLEIFHHLRVRFVCRVVHCPLSFKGPGQIRAGRRQELDGGQVPGARSYHERRDTSELPCIHMRAPIQQELHDNTVTFLTGHIQGGCTGVGRIVDSGAGCQKHPRHLVVPVACRHVQWRDPIRIRLIDARPLPQQPTHHLCRPHRCGCVQSRARRRVRFIDHRSCEGHVRVM
jgi:hypothetical protein